MTNQWPSLLNIPLFSAAILLLSSGVTAAGYAQSSFETPSSQVGWQKSQLLAQEEELYEEELYEEELYEEEDSWTDEQLEVAIYDEITSDLDYGIEGVWDPETLKQELFEALQENNTGDGDEAADPIDDIPDAIEWEIINQSVDEWVYYEELCWGNGSDSYFDAESETWGCYPPIGGIVPDSALSASILPLVKLLPFRVLPKQSSVTYTNARPAAQSVAARTGSYCQRNRTCT